MSQPKLHSNAPFIAWGQAFTLVVLISSGTGSETEEQVRSKSLDTIYELGADDDFKDMLRASLKIEPRDQFFSALLEE